MKNTMFLCLGVSRVESTERLGFFSMVSASSGQEFEIGVTSCLLQRRVGADQRGAVDDQGMRFICPDDSPLCNVRIFVCLRARGAPISWETTPPQTPRGGSMRCGTRTSRSEENKVAPRQHCVERVVCLAHVLPAHLCAARGGAQLGCHFMRACFLFRASRRRWSAPASRVKR